MPTCPPFFLGDFIANCRPRLTKAKILLLFTKYLCFHGKLLCWIFSLTVVGGCHYLWLHHAALLKFFWCSWAFSTFFLAIVYGIYALPTNMDLRRIITVLLQPCCWNLALTIHSLLCVLSSCCFFKISSSCLDVYSSNRPSLPLQDFQVEVFHSH